MSLFRQKKSLKDDNRSLLKFRNINKAMPSWFISKMQSTIVNRGDWLGNPAKIKVENNGAVGYVGSSLTVHNPLFTLSNYEST